MRGALLVLAGALLVAVAVAAAQGRLEEGLRASVRSAAAIGPLLLLALCVMGFTETLLPRGWVERWLTDAAGLRGLVVAWLAGVLTPGGSVIGMPLAAGLVTGGASPAVVVTYLTSMATLNAVRTPMEVGIYGGRVTAVRLLSSAAIPFVAGAVARFVGPIVMGK